MKDNTNETELSAALRQSGRYETAERRSGGIWPAFRFYRLMIRAVCRSGRGLKRSENLAPLMLASRDVLRAVEAAGGRVIVEGAEHLACLEQAPAVLVGNHMSSLETFVLPGLIIPFGDVTFVLKRALLNYPLLGATLRRLQAIAVDRTDPRADLVQVMTEGPEHLSAGNSIIVFPQSTRAETFDPSSFNSLAVKLAKRAGTVVLPFAVDTRFWGSGRWLKDLGPIRPEFTVRITFGPPVEVTGNGREAQEKVIAFIQKCLEEWQ